MLFRRSEELRIKFRLDVPLIGRKQLCAFFGCLSKFSFHFDVPLLYERRLLLMCLAGEHSHRMEGTPAGVSVCFLYSVVRPNSSKRPSIHNGEIG